MEQWVREQYKSNGGFGMKTLETLRSATIISRKEQRNTLLKRFRNIPENMSPMMSPVVSRVKEVNETIPKKAGIDTKSKRLMMLKKWKEEKEKKKLEAKKKSKPVFKVFHVEHKIENLNDVYNNIKGKAISLKGKAAMTPSAKSKASDNAAMPLRPTNSTKENKLKKNSSKETQNVFTTKNGNKTGRMLTAESGKSERSNTSEKQRNILPTSQMEGAKVRRRTPKNARRLSKGQNRSEKNLGISEPIQLEFKAEPEIINQSNIKISSNLSKSKKENKSESPGKMSNIESADKKDRLITKRSKKKRQSESLLEGDPSSDQDEPKLKCESEGEKKLLDTETNSPLLEKDIPKTPRRSRRNAIKDKEETEETSKTSNMKKERDTILSLDIPDSLGKSSSSAGKNLEEVFTTPKKSSDDEICYVSPFVTMSRGKSAARKEFEQRKSLNGSIFNDATDPRSPRAAASYFTRMLDKEINKIQNLCKIWQSYKDEGNLSEDACGLIDMTIGQSNLLITKKFNQFRGLIEKCRANDEIDMKIQCEDLHGFWDMIYKQVTDLEKRFDNLEDMKKNNWLEKTPKAKTPKAIVKEKRKARAKITKASSGLKETILAARRGRMKQIKSDGDIDILIAEKIRTPRVSRKEVGTPGRGILKSTNVKSEKRKTVAFHNLLENLDVSREKLVKGTPIPSRRSGRLSMNRSKLLFDD